VDGIFGKSIVNIFLEFNDLMFKGFMIRGQSGFFFRNIRFQIRDESSINIFIFKDSLSNSHDGVTLDLSLGSGSNSINSALSGSNISGNDGIIGSVSSLNFGLFGSSFLFSFDELKSDGFSDGDLSFFRSFSKNITGLIDIGFIDIGYDICEGNMDISIGVMDHLFLFSRFINQCDFLLNTSVIFMFGSIFSFSEKSQLFRDGSEGSIKVGKNSFDVFFSIEDVVSSFFSFIER